MTAPRTACATGEGGRRVDYRLPVTDRKENENKRTSVLWRDEYFISDIDLPLVRESVEKSEVRFDDLTGGGACLRD